MTKKSSLCIVTRNVHLCYWPAVPSISYILHFWAELSVGQSIFVVCILPSSIRIRRMEYIWKFSRQTRHVEHYLLTHIHFSNILATSRSNMFIFFCLCSCAWQDTFISFHSPSTNLWTWDTKNVSKSILCNEKVLTSFFIINFVQRQKTWKYLLANEMQHFFHLI